MRIGNNAGVVADVDEPFKALRIHDVRDGDGGSFILGGTTGLMVTLATQSLFFVVQNLSDTHDIKIKRCAFNAMLTTPFTGVQTLSYACIIGRRSFNTTFTGGTDLAIPGGNKTLNYNIPQQTQMQCRIATTAALAVNGTIEATNIGIANAFCGAAGPIGEVIPRTNLFDNPETPITLSYLDFFAVRNNNVMTAGGVVRANIQAYCTMKKKE